MSLVVVCHCRNERRRHSCVAAR